jgi:cytochrome c oxidase cbb3-type subunit III
MANPEERDIDPVSGMATTGHAWDGVKELNTPLPKWWLNIFYATIVWAFGYVLLYPAIPLVNSFTTGFLGTSARIEVAAELDALRAQRAVHQTRLAAASPQEITRDPQLLSIAVAQGRAAFGDNCAGCHGLSATGARGFPNLRDDSWLWGGSLEQIQQTIQFGIRNSDDRSRVGQMPAFGGANGMLRREEIVLLANHVRALAGLSTRAGYDANRGNELFAQNCASCHGDEGRGNPEVGAPNLRAQAWLYGGDEATLIETLTQGRGGVMPGWAGRLDDTTVKALTVYVHSLGGGS